ncbi:12291_t:CDS:1, partial [Racocetra fulgida]
RPKRSIINIGVLNGDGIHIIRRHYSSVGFAAKDGANRIYGVTTGHCFADNHTNYVFHTPCYSQQPYFIGTGVIYSEDPDVGLIQVAEPNIKLSATIQNSDSVEYPRLFIKDSRIITDAYIGAHL